MSELRWILIGMGVLLVGAVYFLWGRDLGWRSRRQDEEAEPSRKEPVFFGSGPSAPHAPEKETESDSRPIATEVHAERSSMPQSPPAQGGHEGPATDSPPENLAAPEVGDSKEQGPQKIVVLHVASRGSAQFGGAEVVAALEAENMHLGKFDIFHRLDEASSRSLFSAASMIEPGTFDLTRLDDIITPGVSLFLVLPGPIDGAEAFSEMLITARNLAQRLGAEVLDDKGSSLSNQTAGHIREEILSFELRHRALDDVRA